MCWLPKPWAFDRSTERKRGQLVLAINDTNVPLYANILQVIKTLSLSFWKKRVKKKSSSFTELLLIETNKIISFIPWFKNFFFFPTLYHKLNPLIFQCPKFPFSTMQTKRKPCSSNVADLLFHHWNECCTRPFVPLL